MSETTFLFRPPPFEPEVVEIGNGQIWTKILKLNLIIASEYYARNISIFGNKLQIQEIPNETILNLLCDVLNNTGCEIPNEQWETIKNLLEKLECHDLLNGFKPQIDKIMEERRKEEETRKMMEENPLFPIFLKMDPSLNVITYQIRGSMLISEIKKYISNIINSPANHIHMTYKDTELEDDKTVFSYLIEPKSVISFKVIKPAPPPPPPRPAPQAAQAANPVYEAQQRIIQQIIRTNNGLPPILQQVGLLNQQALAAILTQQLQQQNRTTTQNRARRTTGLAAAPPPPPPQPTRASTSTMQTRSRSYGATPVATPPATTWGTPSKVSQTPKAPAKAPPAPKATPTPKAPPPPPPPKKEDPEVTKKKILQEFEAKTNPTVSPKLKDNSQDPDKIQLVVILPDGKKIGLKLKSNAHKVELVKQKICESVKFNPSKYKLVYGSNSLLDSMRLVDYQINSGAIIYLLPIKP